MTPGVWISLATLTLAILGTAFVTWGKFVLMGATLNRLEAEVKLHASTAVQIARLEEQIKNLTEQMAAQTTMLMQLLPAKARRLGQE